MENKDLQNIFAKVSRLNKEDYSHKKRIDGATVFKRRALGLCGRSSIKSLEEMAKLLHKTGVVSSIEEGRELTPYLSGRTITYNNFTPIGRELGFQRVNNSDGQVAYRIYILPIED